MKLKIRSLAAALAVLLGSTTTQAGAATSFFDDFSTYGVETAGVSAAFFNGTWLLGSNTQSVDLLTSVGSVGQNVCPTAFCVDLDGATNAAAQMTTSFTFDAGTYSVTLGLFGRNPLGLDPNREAFPNDSVKVSFGSGANEVIIFDTGPNAVTAQQALSGSFYVTLTQPLVFNISAGGGDNVGPILTLVDIAAVPLPATASMLLAGLGVLGLVVRRRRTAA